MHISYPVTLLLLLLGPPFSALARKKPDDAILLSNVRALTVRANEQTSHRRVSALPQLTCVGGNAKGLYEIDVLRCKNAGSQYGPEDISWTCQASLPSEFKLGSTEVICEGYDSPDDPYVLKGSCAVEYRLILTASGEEKYRDHLDEIKTREGGWKWDAVLFWFVFLGLILFAVYHSCTAHPRQREHLQGRGGGGGGGDGWDGGDDPPPPYTPHGSWDPKSGNTRSSRGTSTRGSGTYQPGFWTGAAGGAAAGAAAGYAAGAARGNRSQTAQPGPSNWFGGGSGRASSSRSNSSSTESRYESTGFGGTTRR